MEDQIAQLMYRYGRRHDFHHLTSQQRALLLAPDVIDNTDSCGQKTVRVVGIARGSGRLLIDLIDSYTYISHKNGPGGWGDYALARIPVFKKALGSVDSPNRLEDQRYLFRLADSSEVRVRYATEKDRV